MHSSVSCFSVQQSGSHWVSICPCWLIIFGGNFGKSVVLSEFVTHSPVAVFLSSGLCLGENPDAFWESSGHGCTIRTITWLSQVFLFFILLCCDRIELCVLKSLTSQRCAETIPSVECQWEWQFHSPLPFCETWELSFFSVKDVVTPCLSCIPWWVGAGPTFPFAVPHTCLCLVAGT